MGIKKAQFLLGLFYVYFTFSLFSTPSTYADHGNLSARHSNSVLTGQLDGSTEFITLQELTDMRRWAPKANTSDWTP
jgi:hypothetical protein